MADARNTIIAGDLRTNVTTVVDKVKPDARTLFQILKDEDALALNLAASKERRLSEAQFSLKSYFQPIHYCADEKGVVTDQPLFVGVIQNIIYAASKTEYVYREGTVSEMRIMLHEAPTEARDFYELAMSLNASDSRGYYDEPYYLVAESASVTDYEDIVQQIRNDYEKKINESAAFYRDNLAAIHKSFNDKKIAAALRYDKAKLIANEKTIIEYNKNYQLELEIAEGVFCSNVTENITQKKAALNQLLVEREKELADLPAYHSEPIVSYEELQAAFQHNLLCDAEDRGLEFVFSYKTSSKEVELYALKQPETADEFYDLAMRINAGQHRFQGNYFDIYHKGELADASVVKEFMFSILSDAAKAGHLLAKNQIIEATMKGDPVACKHVVLKEFSVIPGIPATKGMLIKLPRLCATAEEWRKLGSDLLIQFRKGNCVADRPLVGSYYEVANGMHAKALSECFDAYSQKLRTLKEFENAKNAYSDQTMRVAQNSSAMFGANFAANERLAKASSSSSSDYVPSMEERSVSPTPSILSTGTMSSDSEISSITPISGSPTGLVASAKDEKANDHAVPYRRNYSL